MGPGVPFKSFLATIWVCAALVIVFLTVRLYTRLFRGARRLHWDDGLAIFAALLVIISACLWQWAADPMYRTLSFPPEGQVIPADFSILTERWMRVAYAVKVFFYTTLTAVKLSLLFFFRRLGGHMDRLRYIWWPIIGLTLAFWATAIGTLQYKCLLSSAEYVWTYCQTPAAIEFATVTMKINSALDVFTDVLILLIPVILVWGVQLQMKTKLAFTGLFSLTVITMIIAIVRVVGITASKWENGQNDPSFIFFWSAIEACIAVVVACLSSFPQLFTTTSKKQTYRPSESFVARLRARQGQGQRPSNLDFSRMAARQDDDPLRVSLAESRTPPELSEVVVVHDDKIGKGGYMNMNMNLYNGIAIEKPTPILTSESTLTPTYYHRDHGEARLESVPELPTLPK